MNAGTGKTVNITALTLGGVDAANYTLARNTATTLADIAKAQLSLTGFTAQSKNYDGTTAATVLNAGVLSGDSVAFSGTAAAFAGRKRHRRQ